MLGDESGGRYRKGWNPYRYYQDLAVAESYDRKRFASLPRRVFNALEKRCLRKALATVPANACILDAPCGTGRLAETILGLGFRVVGIDISEPMLSVARNKLARFGSRFEGRVMDARALEGERMRFDASVASVCARFLMHVPVSEQIAFLRAIAAVTTGQIIFNQGLDTLYNQWRRGLKRRLGHTAPAAFPLSEAELARLVSEAGLKLERHFRVCPRVSEAVFFVCRKADQT